MEIIAVIDDETTAHKILDVLASDADGRARLPLASPHTERDEDASVGLWKFPGAPAAVSWYLSCAA